MWDPIEFYDDLEHYFKIMLTCGTNVGSWCRWLGEQAYMWDLEKFYHDLKHSIFLKKAYMWDPTEFYDDLEDSTFKIMHTCGTKIGLWRYCGAYGVTKQAWNRERSATISIVMMKVLFSLNFLESEI
jgi:hypothetical protein